MGVMMLPSCATTCSVQTCSNRWMAAVVPGGKRDLPGYVSSRYSAMTMESVTTFPVWLSMMVGVVYLGVPSGLMDVGGTPNAFTATGRSGNSNHLVSTGIPLKARANLARHH